MRHAINRTKNDFKLIQGFIHTKYRISSKLRAFSKKRFAKFWLLTNIKACFYM